MNKSSANSPLNNVNLGEDWSSHPAIEWLNANKKTLLWVFLALIACLILAYRFASARTLNAETDFFHAQTAFTQFQQASLSSKDSSDPKDFDELKTILERRPEIKPRYEGAVAQSLLITNQPDQARPFAKEIFERAQPNHLQLYQDYSQTSILIGEGNFADAMQKTQQLQTILDQGESRTNSILYVFNLIRLAFLYQQMGQSENELAAWRQLQNQPQHLEAVLAANEVLKVGHASLSEYIEERKKMLTP